MNRAYTLYASAALWPRPTGIMCVFIINRICCCRPSWCANGNKNCINCDSPSFCWCAENVSLEMIAILPLMMREVKGWSGIYVLSGFVLFDLLTCNYVERTTIHTIYQFSVNLFSIYEYIYSKYDVLIV